MNENQNVDIDREQDNGQITYANEVISTIVSVATTEVDGISAIAGSNGLLGKGKMSRCAGRHGRRGCQRGCQRNG